MLCACRRVCAAVRVAEIGPRGFHLSAHAGPQMARWPLDWALGLLAAVAICECNIVPLLSRILR